MATDWIYRVHLIVRAGSRSAANQRAQELGIGGSDEDDVFGVVRLSALGHGEPTDLGCSTLMTASMLENLQSTAEEPAFAGLRYYCLDARLRTLIATNSPNDQELIGEQWDWQHSLEDIGLSRITEAAPRADT